MFLLTKQINRIENPNRKDRWNYSDEELTEGKFLGQGSFGSVYECRLPSQLGIFAVKKISFPKVNRHIERRFRISWMMELQALKQVHFFFFFILSLINNNNNNRLNIQTL